MYSETETVRINVYYTDCQYSETQAVLPSVRFDYVRSVLSVRVPGCQKLQMTA